jgi:hypothetical protein
VSILRVKKLLSSFLTALFLAVLAVAVTTGQLPAKAEPACQIVATSSSPTSDTEEQQLKNAYLKAICDASEKDPSELSDRLLKIAADNPKLDWRNSDKKEFLAVTWTSWNGYDGKDGTSLQLGADVWVTAVPEVKEFCANFSSDDPRRILRLEAFLGLPPRVGKTKFVEMWVNPSDMYRPCPDKEIDDASCDLDFPPTVDPQHKDWYNRLQSASYEDKGYPWTGLGYTYDWGNHESEFGASEFIVKKGSTVLIRAVQSTLNYCQPKTS